MNISLDSTNLVRIKILEYLTTLIVGEMLFNILFNLGEFAGGNDINSANHRSVHVFGQDASVGQGNASEPLNNILTDLLLDIFAYYSTQSIEDRYLANLNFSNSLFFKAKEVWSKNFGLVSQFYFEECYKVLQKVMIDDLNNQEDSETPNRKLCFYKYLCITPTKKLISSHVLFLLNHFKHALSSKRLIHSTKIAVLQ